MKTKLLSEENWSEVLKEIEDVIAKFGVIIEPSFYYLGHKPLEEYLPGKFGINRGFLSVILPSESSILHTELIGSNVGGWFTIINGKMSIQIYERGIHSIDHSFKYWESEIIIHELCHYYYWNNGLVDRTHYWHYEKRNLMSAVDEIVYELYLKKIGLMEQAVRLLRKLTTSPISEEVEKLKVVHHSATSRDYTKVETIVNNLKKKYKGGFYNYIIDKDGNIYEQEVSDKYRDTVDILVIGNFTTEEPLPAQIKALKSLIGKNYISHKKLADKGFATPSLCPGVLMDYL